MGSRDLEEDVYDFLERIQLEQFFDKVHHILHLTRLSHFDHVTEGDLAEINMSKPEQRRLFDALKKYKKEKKRTGWTRFSFRKNKKKESSGSGSTNSTPVSSSKSCLISEDSLHLQEEIGNGNFGIVRKGHWTTNTGAKLPVAVKSLKYSNDEEFVKDQNDFMREASAMSNLDHPNVIRLYGIALSTPMQLVMELASLGSLLDRLQQEPHKFLISTLCHFVIQVASGMSYLESKRYVHRDLAARNLLLSSYDRVKIGDFGLIRPLSNDEEIYVMNPTGRVPFAWCAPECLKTREFSHASDVWAFGITVFEIFSYGKQPWAGLTAAQILDIVDEPACGRPSKPDHCPDKIYSVLIDDCWAHEPSDRPKFVGIEKKLTEVFPQDVTMLFELEANESSDRLSAQPGDIITVITWKSRLGKEFAKGQNQRTRQVGYFPREQITRALVKKGSKSRSRVSKIKDISPPLDNSFSHCAHRGEGESENWGPIQTDRFVVGKQVPLNLPTRLVQLKDSDGENESLSERWSNDALSINGMETSSLSSRDSVLSNHSGRGSRSPENRGDSGYYSNRDTYVSDYEPMNGSHPISIPSMRNQVLCRRPPPPVVNYPLTYSLIPQPLPRDPSHESLHCGPCNNQQFCDDGTRGSEDPPVKTASGSDLRPALPPKQGIGLIGRSACGGRPVMQSNPQYPGTNRGTEDPHVNSSVMVDSCTDDEIIYEDCNSGGVPSDPSIPSSSPNSFYLNEPNTFFCANKLFRGIANVKHCKVCVSVNCTCPLREGRSHSFTAGGSQNRTLKKENTKKANSWSCLGESSDSRTSNKNSTAPMPVNGTNSTCESPVPEIVTTSPLGTSHWETRTAEEALTEDIYENIDNFNAAINEALCLSPPPLPMKRRRVVRSKSDPPPNESHGVDPLPRNCRSSTFSYQPNGDWDYAYEQPSLQSSAVKSNPVVSGKNFAPIDAHTYMEISEELSEKLRLDVHDDSGAECSESEMEGQEKDVETRSEAGVSARAPKSQQTFQEISKDFTDQVVICAKPVVPNSSSEPTMNRAPYRPNQSTFLQSQSAPEMDQASSDIEDKLWKRFSAGEHCPNCHSSGRQHFGSNHSTTKASNSPEYHSTNVGKVKIPHKRVALVTTV